MPTYIAKGNPLETHHPQQARLCAQLLHRYACMAHQAQALVREVHQRGGLPELKLRTWINMAWAQSRARQTGITTFGARPSLFALRANLRSSNDAMLAQAR